MYLVAEKSSKKHRRYLTTYRLKAILIHKKGKLTRNLHVGCRVLLKLSYGYYLFYFDSLHPLVKDHSDLLIFQLLHVFHEITLFMDDHIKVVLPNIARLPTR